MYAYNLLVKNGQGVWTYVRPGPDMEIPTLAELHQQIKHDLGFVPRWLETAATDEYLGVEDEVEIHATWFLLEIEGSQDHTLPPLAERIARDRDVGR